MPTLIAAVLALSSLSIEPNLPDGGRIVKDGSTVARHAADGTVIWRVGFVEAPKVEIDGSAIRVESASVALADSVVAAADAREGFKPVLRIYWKNGRGNSEITTTKTGPWSYVQIGSHALLRLQHDVLAAPAPKTVRKANAVYVSAGAAGVLDDGTFTVAELMPDWLVDHYKGIVAKRAETEQGTRAKEIVAGRWLQTESPMPLSSLEGRVVLLDFWGNWCAPCVSAIPKVTALAKKSGLAIIGIHSKQGADRVESFLARKPFPIPIAIDTGGKTEAEYVVRAWPTYILIDRKGTIRYRGIELPAEQLIDELLAEKP